MRLKIVLNVDIINLTIKITNIGMNEQMKQRMKRALKIHIKMLNKQTQNFNVSL